MVILLDTGLSPAVVLTGFNESCLGFFVGLNGTIVLMFQQSADTGFIVVDMLASQVHFYYKSTCSTLCACGPD